MYKKRTKMEFERTYLNYLSSLMAMKIVEKLNVRSPHLYMNLPLTKGINGFIYFIQGKKSIVIL